MSDTERFVLEPEAPRPSFGALAVRAAVHALVVGGALAAFDVIVTIAFAPGGLTGLKHWLGVAVADLMMGSTAAPIAFLEPLARRRDASLARDLRFGALAVFGTALAALGSELGMRSAYSLSGVSSSSSLASTGRALLDAPLPQLAGFWAIAVPFTVTFLARIRSVSFGGQVLLAGLGAAASGLPWLGVFREHYQKSILVPGALVALAYVGASLAIPPLCVLAEGVEPRIKKRLARLAGRPDLV